MTILIICLLSAIVRLERELGRLWRENPTWRAASGAARGGVLSAYLDLHELCVGLLRRYLAESVLTPDAAARACYGDLMEAAAAAGLVEDKAAWLRAGKERANAERELEGKGVVEDIDVVCEFGERVQGLIGRVCGC
jgi:hypothetical protein